MIQSTKNLEVKLISTMTRKSFTDIAAKITRSQEPLDDIVSMEYDPKLVDIIMNMGHLAATEFDYYVFAVSGLSRVTEVQLVRKRLASYMISSGRAEKHGNRQLDYVMPESIINLGQKVYIGKNSVFVNGKPLSDYLSLKDDSVQLAVWPQTMTNIFDQWYVKGVDQGYKEQDLRYLRPQALMWRGLIAMNAHGLLDWFKIRCCYKAQDEINRLAWAMCKLCKEKSPDVFKKAGPNCVSLGYCPENKQQCQYGKAKGILTHDKVLELISNYKQNTMFPSHSE